MTYDLGPSPVTPVERLLLLNDDSKWEDFIEDCVRELANKEQYVSVDRLGGAGDKGRDICAYLEPQATTDNSWDLYQAKYYSSTGMSPGNFFPEVAKFFDMVHLKNYSKPRKYYLCTLKIGSSLHDCFKDSIKFKNDFIQMVIDKKGILGIYKIKSNIDDYINYVKEFDFSIFDYLLPKDLIEIHSTSPNHWKRFGELPLRGADPSVPTNHESYEEVYIRELLKLYNDVTQNNFTLQTLPIRFNKHLNAQRNAFFMAEGLKRFSRDKIPEAFDDLLKEVLASIETILFNYFENNMDKFTKIIQNVNSTKITNNPLSHRLKSADLSGCCHHLVNNNEFTWVDDDENL